MEIEEAITTAIEFERKVRDIYFEGASLIKDDTGKSFFKILGADEQSHLDYLEYKLSLWQKQGKIEAKTLKTVVPSLEEIKKGEKKLRATVARDHMNIAQRMLSSALKSEKETSAFYERMVQELPEEGRALFKPFVDIENRHIDVVQYELDQISSTGYWFDYSEFDMDGC